MCMLLIKVCIAFCDPTHHCAAFALAFAFTRSVFKILAPHAHVAAQAHAAAALSTLASSQQVGANTSASAQDEVALAHTCCAGMFFRDRNINF